MKLNFLKQKHFDHANQAHSHREVYAAVPPNGPPLPTSCPYSWLEGLLASQPGRNESISMAGRPASKTGCRNRKTWHSHLSCHVVSLQAPIFHLPLSLTVALHGHSWFQPPKSHDLFYTKKSYENNGHFVVNSVEFVRNKKSIFLDTEKPFHKVSWLFLQKTLCYDCGLRFSNWIQDIYPK